MTTTTARYANSAGEVTCADPAADRGWSPSSCWWRGCARPAERRARRAVLDPLLAGPRLMSTSASTQEARTRLHRASASPVCGCAAPSPRRTTSSPPYPKCLPATCRVTIRSTSGRRRAAAGGIREGYDLGIPFHRQRGWIAEQMTTTSDAWSSSRRNCISAGDPDRPRDRPEQRELASLTVDKP